MPKGGGESLISWGKSDLGCGMLKLHRLKIERFRTVKPCELYFNDGLNILLGRNGSGKTSLLKLITALYRSPIGEILPGEEYELEVEFRLSVGSIIAHIKRTFGHLNAIRAMDPGNLEDLSVFELDIQIAFGSKFELNAKCPHPHHNHFNAWLLKYGDKQDKLSLDYRRLSVLLIIIELIHGQSFTDPANVRDNEIDLRFGNSLAPFRFDESLDALDVIREKKIGFSVWRNGVPAITATDSLPVGYLDLFYKHLSDNPTRSNLVLDDKSLEFLKKFIDMTSLQSARMVCERIEKNIRAGSPELTWNVFGNFRFSFIRRDGSEFWQDQLSYGQKRLLIFLYYISAFSQVIISDELVNGLHHEWIEACVRAMQGKQAFLTSQNPLLLDHLSFESQEEVRKTFLLCSATPQPSGDVMQWKNMSQTEAEIFYQAYQVGIQHVSEILHSEGLW